MSGWNLVNHSQ